LPRKQFLRHRLVAKQFCNRGNLLALLRDRGGEFGGVAGADDLPSRRDG
jgi:hypothetical protein